MNEETEVIKETAKATQEVAKTASNAIDAGREMGGGYFQIHFWPIGARYRNI